MDMHGRIMNIQHSQAAKRENWIDYAEGHRDARHAAAEIAIEGDALIAEMLAALEAAEPQLIGYARLASLAAINRARAFGVRS